MTEPGYGLKIVGDPFSAAEHNELYTAVKALYDIVGLIIADGTNAQAAVASDIVGLFTGSGDYLKPDGTQASWPTFNQNTTGNAGSIGTGDTGIAPVDTGTGYIPIEVDGEEQERIYDGYRAIINGTLFRLLTTTSGHAYSFQAYDANGTTWRDVLTFTSGDSSDSDPNNWPRVKLGSNVALTGLGNMATGLIWGNAGAPITSNQDLEAAGMNQIYKVGATLQVNLPAAADCYSSGSHAAWVTYVIIGSYTVSFDPDGSEMIRSISTTAQLLAAGNELDITGPGIVTLYVTDDVEDGSSTDGWIGFSPTGTALSDGGAS